MSFSDMRKYKLFNMAIIDFVITFIAVFLIHYYIWTHPIHMKNTTERTTLQYISSLLLLFITAVGLGVLLHYFLGIKSGLSGHLGFNDIPDINR